MMMHFKFPRHSLLTTSLPALCGCLLAIETGLANELGTKVTFPSEDDLTVTADLYAPAGMAGQPVVVLFHQAGFSRGEYCDIAPRLTALGFACLAVDQRSGNQANGVVNETAKLARANGLSTAFEDALQDMRAALAYAGVENGGSAPVIGMGSSYSSALILTIAADRPELVDGTLSFSPGEYFNTPKLIETAAAKVNVPAFITSARSERNSWSAIFNAIASPEKVSFVPSSAGRHGASTLWPTTADNGPTWQAVENFLMQWLPEPDTTTRIDQNRVTGEVTATFSSSRSVIEASADLTSWYALAAVDEGEEPARVTFPAEHMTSFLRTQTVDEGFDTSGANVTAVTASGAPGSYTFNVSISSPDTGCEQYADWWEVLSEEGDLLYRRVLLHSHVNENPFTRSGGSVSIDADQIVWVRAHMNHSGYGGAAMKGSVTAGFAPEALPSHFAPWAVIQNPLPDGCAF